MKKSEISEMRKRWQTSSFHDLRTALDEGISPFGLINGLRDYRGVSVSVSLHGIVLSGLDFSYSEMEHGQFASEVRGCRFENVCYESNLGKFFQDCDFTSAKLDNCVLRGAFVRCDFTRANLTHVRASAVTFEDCRFVDTILRNGSFFDCTFKGCYFESVKLISGTIAGCKFLDSATSGLSVVKSVTERVIGL